MGNKRAAAFRIRGVHEDQEQGFLGCAVHLVPGPVDQRTALDAGDCDVERSMERRSWTLLAVVVDNLDDGSAAGVVGTVAEVVQNRCLTKSCLVELAESPLLSSVSLNAVLVAPVLLVLALDGYGSLVLFRCLFPSFRRDLLWQKQLRQLFPVLALLPLLFPLPRHLVEVTRPQQSPIESCQEYRRDGVTSVVVARCALGALATGDVLRSEQNCYCRWLDSWGRMRSKGPANWSSSLFEEHLHFADAPLSVPRLGPVQPCRPCWSCSRSLAL